MKHLKPKDIDYIIDLIEKIVDALTKLQKLQSSKRYEAPDLSTAHGRPTPKERIKAKLEQLQDKLYPFLTPLWPEICDILQCSQQDNQLRREVEALINYRYDQRKYDQYVSRYFSQHARSRYRFGFDNSLNAYKKNLIRKFRWVKKILIIKSTQPIKKEEGQKGRPKIWKPELLEKCLGVYTKEYAKTDDSKAAWNTVADQLFNSQKSGDAVRVACQRYQKNQTVSEKK